MKKKFIALPLVFVIFFSVLITGYSYFDDGKPSSNLLSNSDQWFPFTIPWDDKSDNVINVGKLVLDAPAGKHGFLKIKDGHFFFEDGTRMRFWGTNLSGGANFPTHEEAEKVAAHMAKYGFNMVRLHHMDSNYAPNGIFNKSLKNTSTLDEEQLDKLDYLIFQFKQNGIYVDINLHVGRKFTETDGIVDAKYLPRNSKQVTLFDEKLIDLEKDYAKKLLTHYNPYTESSYNDEPCVALVETTNENSLFTAWTNGALFGKTDEALPEYYRKELDSKFNQWLQNKYVSTEDLKSAWDINKKTEGENLVKNGIFDESLENGWVKEIHSGVKADLITEDNQVKIDILTSGKEQSALQLKQLGINLEKGKKYTFKFNAKSDNNQEISVSFGKEKSPWTNYGLSGKASLTSEWTDYSFNFIANSTTDEITRLSFLMGKASGEIFIDNVTLNETGIKGLEQDESLDVSNVNRTAWDNRFAYTDKRLQDNTEFYYSLEKDFFKDMNTYIHDDLGIKVPVSSSNNYNGQADLMAQNEGDYIDAHGYWDHPSFPGTRFDKNNFKQTNRSLVSSNSFIYNPGTSFNSSPIIRYSMSSVEGKPLVVSEWNDVFPNDYDYEEAGILAAYSLFQDWDGLFIYTYHGSQSGWDSGKIDSWFEVGSNPGKMSQMPALALAFIRGDFNSAKEKYSLNYSKNDVLASFINKSGAVDYGINGTFPNFMPYLHMVRKSSFDVEKTTDSSDLISKDVLEQLTNSKVLKSDTGEIMWDNSEQGKEFLTFDTDRFQGAVGFLSGKSIILKNLEIKDSSDSSIFLTSIDGKKIETSDKMLLTVVSSQINTNEEKNDQQGLKNWGKAPVLMKAVTGRVKLSVSGHGRDYSIYPLDSEGNRKEALNAVSCNGFIEFDIGESDTTWYEITK